MLSQKQVFDTLERLGVARVCVEYSGGHDEGGVDSISCLNSAGEKLEIGLPEWVVETSWNDDKQSYEAKELSETEQLYIALCEPVCLRWGGFAGEFHVHGRLTWDVESREIDDSVGDEWGN